MNSMHPPTRLASLADLPARGRLNCRLSLFLTLPQRGEGRLANASEQDGVGGLS